MNGAYVRTRLHDKCTWISLLVLFFYSAAGLIPGVMPRLAGNDLHRFFDMHFTAFFSLFTVALVQIPLYFVFILVNRHFFFNAAVYVRFSDSRRYWARRFLAFAEDAVIYVLFLYLLLLGQFACLGRIAALQGHERFLLICFGVQCLSYFAFSVLLTFVSIAFNSQMAGFFCLYGLIVADYFEWTSHWLGIGSGNREPLFFLTAICLNPVHMERCGPMALLMAGLAAGLFLLLPVLCGSRDILDRKKA